MKKLLLNLILLTIFSAASAQTNFRHISFTEGVAAAKAEGKLVFVDFFTTWCGPCNMMTQDIFPQEEVGDYFNENFVCLKIDAEKGEGIELAKRFEITGYPTFVVLNTDGEELGRQIGAILDGQDFISAIERIANPEKSPERLKERYGNGERSAELISAYADYLIASAYQGEEVNQELTDEAHRVVKEYFDSLTDKQRTAEENLFIYLQHAESPLDEYGRYMTAHFKKFPSTAREEIAAQIASLYEIYLSSLFAGHQPYHKEEYETVKREVEKFGLNKDKRYTPVFRLIEEYAKGDINAFLSLCEQEYKNLSETDKGNLILGMNDLIKTDDEEVLRRAAQFIRARLPEMSVANIYFAAGVIDQLESRNTQLRSIVPAVPAGKR